MLSRFLSFFLEPVRGYSRMVLSVKLILGIAALTLFSLLMYRLLIDSRDTQTDISWYSQSNTNLTTMKTPRFYGVNQAGHHYLIAADQAKHKDKHDIELFFPSADIQLKNQDWILVSAQKGMYRKKKSHLELHHDVSFLTNHGDALYTEKAMIDLESETAYGPLPVNIVSDMGTCLAGSFHLDKKQQLLTFSGGVRMVLYPFQ